MPAGSNETALSFAVVVTLLVTVVMATAQNQNSASAQPAVAEWFDDFDGDKLDEAKWELYTFERRWS